jgi:hypothetical protein
VAQEAINDALAGLVSEDGQLPEMTDGKVGVAAATSLLERNISRRNGSPYPGSTRGRNVAQAVRASSGTSMAVTANP